MSFVIIIWYQNRVKKLKLLYKDIKSLIPLTKTDNFYEYTAGNVEVEKWFDTSNYDKRRRPLKKGGKIISLIRDKRRGKIIAEFATTAPKK